MVLQHAYSRARVKFSVQKNDNHIIRQYLQIRRLCITKIIPEAIATLDNLDKAVNLFS